MNVGTDLKTLMMNKTQLNPIGIARNGWNSQYSLPPKIPRIRLSSSMILIKPLTAKLTIEAVWEIRMLDQAITSELMIKPMEDGSFQYLSNKVIKSDQNANAGWYMPRLTEEEWEENYSNN